MAQILNQAQTHQWLLKQLGAGKAKRIWEVDRYWTLDNGDKVCRYKVINVANQLEKAGLIEKTTSKVYHHGKRRKRVVYKLVDQ